MPISVLLPELPDSLQWLNATPAQLRDLRGRAVLLAFVSASSAWCWQALNLASQWQVRFPGRLQVLAINLPRFDFERDAQSAFALWRRQNIALPLAHDNDWVAWQRFGIEAWPTLLLLDADGKLHAQAVGQDGLADLEKRLIRLCDALPAQLDDNPKSLLKPIREPQQALRFPTALAANEERLFIADTGHHRVLECTLAGRVLRTFGMGTPDFIDGEGDQAGFRSPQGLALSREWLYVADAGNHALRRISLRTGSVDTLVGSGRCGAPVEGKVASPREVSLSQPQGVYANDNEVIVALAGDNRLWSYDLMQHVFACRAGSGELEAKDGSSRRAAFAQPMALAAQPPTLYVADGLGSSLRTMHLRNELVNTVIGGNGAWDSGDADGDRAAAKMQFPLALAIGAGKLWIADAGNGRVRSLRLGGGEIDTVKLPGLSGVAGLAFAGGKLFLSEADLHRIRRYDPASATLEQVDIVED